MGILAVIEDYWPAKPGVTIFHTNEQPLGHPFETFILDDPRQLQEGLWIIRVPI